MEGLQEGRKAKVPLFSREGGERESSVDLPFDHRVFSRVIGTSKEKICDVIAGRTIVVSH